MMKLRELLIEALKLCELPVPKKSLGDIVNEGQAKMHDAVEAVIARHEGEIKKIEDYAKAEKESALVVLDRYGTASASDHQRRMDALVFGPYINSLSSLGSAHSQRDLISSYGNGALQGIGASSLGAGGWL